MVEANGATFAVAGASPALNLQLHKPLRRKADHLAQQIGIRTLLQERLKAHHLVGHRRVLGSVEGANRNPTEDPAMTTAVDK
jgi:hypothetical protein